MRRRSLAAAAAAILVVSVLAGTALAHPHVVRQITLPLQSGQLEVKYFTLPYDAKTLEGIPEGFFWHLGFATLKVSGPVTAGGEAVKAGSYHLFTRLGAGGKWSIVLLPEGSGRTLVGAGFQLLQEKDEAKRKTLLDQMQGLASGMTTLPTDFSKGSGSNEHLRITVED